MLKCFKLSPVPPYPRFDAFMKAYESVNQINKLKEYDRLLNVLYTLRAPTDNDFGMEDAWTVTDNVYFKGCEPLQYKNEPVIC